MFMVLHKTFLHIKKKIIDSLSGKYLPILFYLMLLLLLLLIPIVGIFVISTDIFKNNENNNLYIKRIKLIGLITSLINLFISLIIFIFFDFSINQFQFVQESHDIKGFNFYLGIDGLSIYFVLLTTIIMPIAILSN
jgi:NADH:ubiquinone oxidoreductase subunit 4 (subunit M)